MKIEMGESLIYSWLRHVKECHIVQTNWKVSPNWELINNEQIAELRAKCEAMFPDTMKEAVFKNMDTSQILSQGEIDVLGISLVNNEHFVHAVDIAFHKNGLNYKGKVESIARVVKKSLRTVMCLLGYGIAQSGEIIFASPKIHNAVYNELLPAIQRCNEILNERQLNFTIRVIANGDFEEKIFRPTLIVGKNVADTSELFLRSMQLYWMFGQDECDSKRPTRQEGLDELKIGKIVKTKFFPLLENSAIPPDEIERLQDADYSKAILHLNYPCLVKATRPFNKDRYYASSLNIDGVFYKLCNDWYEGGANDDRPYLLRYIAKYRQPKTLDDDGTGEAG